MSELNASNLRKERGNEGPDLVGITTLSSQHYMVPPSGTTAQRPQNPQKGTLRFNTDIGSLEFFRGDTLGWESIVKTSPNLGGGTGSNAGTGARGLLGGGSPDNSNGTDTITFITISTLGADQDFGDLTDSRKQPGGTSSRTRALFSGGSRPSYTSTVTDYVTISSTGDAIDFGDNYNDNGTGQGEQYGGTSNGTRAVWNGGYRSGTNINTISYNTISTLGDALNFGDRTTGGFNIAAVNSSTRSIVAGGSNPGSLNIIDYVIMSTLGNSVDFGDLTTASRSGGQSACSSTRGVIPLGYYTPGAVGNRIDYITMATTGNAIDFGDSTQARKDAGGMSSPTRGVFAGGLTPTVVNTIDYIEIPTTGNAVDFGDTGGTFSMSAGVSNGHGGL